MTGAAHKIRLASVVRGCAMRVRFELVAAKLVVAAVLLVGVAVAQDAYSVLRERLTTVADPSYQKLAREFEIVDAATGDTGETTFQPVPGKWYFVYGLCDANCTNIDIELSDSSDRWFREQDQRLDATPVVTIPRSDSPREIGITLEMVDCKTATCKMGIGIYSVEFE